MMNETMLTVLLIVVIVAIVVVALVVRWFLNSFMAQQKAVIAKESSKHALSVKFQAYERMVLLVERLSPESLVIREQQAGLTAAQFHGLLLKSVRHEFDYNMAMQLYLETETWNRIQLFREELLRLINSSAASIVPNAPSLELGRVILEQAASVNQYSRQSLDGLRVDLRIYY